MGWALVPFSSVIGVILSAIEGISSLVLIEPRRFSGIRGWFSETWNKRGLAEAGATVDFVQNKHSCSRLPATLRDLHYQAPPHVQDKLVHCSRGAVLDLAVDVRVGSPSVGQWVGVELSAENGKQLFVPKGFLHGFVSLVADTEVQYKCSDYCAPDCDASLRWDSLGIDWHSSGFPMISDKDMQACTLSDWQSPFVFEETAK